MIGTQIFKNRNFLLYWIGSLFAGLGDAVFSIALTWMVVEVTGSGAMVGALFLTIGVPRVVLTPCAGVLVDRINPVKGMILCEWARVLTVGFLLLLSFFGTLPLWNLFVASLFLLTLIRLPHDRPDAQPAPADANDDGKTTLSDVEESAASRSPGNRVRRLYWADMREGVAYILKTPIILTTSLVAFLVNACSSVAPIGVPFLAESLGGGAREFGWLNTSIGIGGTIGAILFSVFIIKRPTPRMTLIACFAEGIVFLTLGLAEHLWLALLLIALIGITDAAINVIAPSVNQTIIPPELMGRVISVVIVLMSVSVPLAQAAGGYLVETAGVQNVFLINGSLEMMIAGIAFFLPVIRKYGRASA
jgi:MFS family permease